MDRIVDSQTYWDDQASTYDATYQSPWSLAEDRSVIRLMRTLHLPNEPTVLDLGCGTGLGLRLLCRANIQPRYVGIDVSKNMLKNFDSGSVPREFIQLHHCDIGSMDSLSIPTPDLVLSTFGSLNFVEDRWKPITQLAESQSAGSKIMVMLLNRWSLRRLIRFKFSRSGRYQTRSTRHNVDVRAHFDSVQGASDMLKKAGYKICSVSGGGPLAGVLELETLWKLNQMFGNLTTLMSHTITLIGERRRH